MYDDELSYRKKIRCFFPRNFKFLHDGKTLYKHHSNIEIGTRIRGPRVSQSLDCEELPGRFSFFFNLLITLNSKSLINRIEHRNFLIDYFGKRPEDFVVKTDFVKGLKKNSINSRSAVSIVMVTRWVLCTFRQQATRWPLYFVPHGARESI